MKSWVIITLFLTALNHSVAQNVLGSTVSNQLLWQISGNGLSKPSYLFGSYHSNDPRVFKLSDSTWSSLQNAEAIVLEADIYQLFTEYDIRNEPADLRFDPKGNPFTADRRATKTKYGSEDGRPQFLDLYFQQLAYNMGKPVFPLESIEEQIQAFEAVYSRSPQRKSLDQFRMSGDNMLNAYLMGDIDLVLHLIRNQLNDSKTAFEALIVKRNIQMANGIDSLCRKKALFVAIGAGHLAGGEGVIQLLRKKGYHVRQVVAGFSESRTEAEKTLLQYNKYLYEDQRMGFKAVFGGKPIRDSLAGIYRLLYQEMGQGNTYIIEIEPYYGKDFDAMADGVIDRPEKAALEFLTIQNQYPAYQAIGYEYGAGLAWKRVIHYKDKVVKLICYGGNKFMNSNRPKAFFDQFVIE